MVFPQVHVQLGPFLGCNGAVWMDGVDIGVADGSGGAVSVSVSFVTKKFILELF